MRTSGGLIVPRVFWAQEGGGSPGKKLGIAAIGCGGKGESDLSGAAKGNDVVALFAVFQNCPQGIMVHASRGMKSIADVFTGGTLAMEPGLPYVNFLKNKYSFDKIKVVPYDGGLGNFLNNKDFSQQCFITSEPLAAKKSGSDPATTFFEML